MPTGGGKSICFQIPALVNDGLSIIVSPLIALMNDQVMSLRESGINAYALHSNVDEGIKRKIAAEIEEGKVKLLYLSPEGLLTESMVNYLSKKKINLIAIDEAHCLSMWGNDFRPEYVKLSALKSYFPDVPIMAVTATADKATQKDIVDKLKFRNPEIFIGSFERENITIRALPGIERLKQIKNFLKVHKDEAGIIYCTSRKNTESVANKLAESGHKAAFYHAGMSSDDRSKVHEDFIYDRVQIVCATIAFGMGIDKANIRFVIHYNLSKNIESYYQEIGRSGRDGSPAEALAFYSYADITQLTDFITNSQSDSSYKEVQMEKLDRIWEFANTAHCRSNIILNYFDEFRSEGCGHCDNCLQPPETFDGTKIAQMALSAIWRGKEQMTIGLLIDVLRGSMRREVVALGLDKIKTHGVGRGMGAADWKSYLTQILHQGLISIDYSQGSRVKLTPLSNEVLFEGKEVQLVKFVWEDRSKKPAKAPKPDIWVESELLDMLKRLRNSIASKQNVPAYVIFSNKTLEEMSSMKPTTLEEFADISGVGSMKLEKYGKIFIEAIEGYGG